MKVLYFTYRRKAATKLATYTIDGLSFLREYQIKLLKCSYNQGESALKNSATANIADVQHFVINP